MNRRVRRVVVGALAAAVLVTAGLIVRDTGGERGQRLTLVVESANGLIQGGQVRAGGVQVGEITDIELGSDGYPRVNLRLGKEYTLREGVRADVRLGSQSGQLNRFIDLHNGRGRTLGRRATLARSQTTGPVELADAADMLTPAVRQQVRGILAAVDRSTAGQGPTLAASLREAGGSLNAVAALADDISADRQALRTLVTRSAQGAQALSASGADLAQATTQTARVLEIAAQRQSALSESLAAAPAALQAPRPLLRRVPRETPRLRRALTQIDRGTRLLGTVSRELQRTASVAPDTLARAQEVTNTVRRGAPILNQLLEQATPVVRDAIPAAKTLGPVLDQVRSRLPDALNWLFNLGDASASYDAAGHGLRLLGMFVDPPRRLTSGPDDCTPGLLRRPFDRTPGVLACDPWTDFTSSFVAGGLDPKKALDPSKATLEDILP